MEIQFKLPKTLQVTVYQATNLKLDRRQQAPNPTAKVGIPGIDQTSVTEVILHIIVILII